MRRRYSKDPLIDRSLRHSVRDGVAYSVMAGAGETYFSAFALYFKASTAQIGILASLPLLLGALTQLLSAWLGRRTGQRRSIIVGGAALQAASWIPLLILPLLFPSQGPALIIACVILYQAAGGLTVPQWNSLMGDLVPERRRGRYFARRTRLASATAFLALLCAGVILDHFDRAGATFAGYLTVFAVAALARLVSTYHLAQMHDPPGKVAALSLPRAGDLRRRLRHSPFARFALFFALMQFSVAVASPFFAVYMLRDLQLSYIEFTVVTATSVLTQFLTLNTWGRISDAFGNRLILALTGFLIPLLPLLWLASTQLWYLVLIQMASGLAWAGFSLSAANSIYDLVPRDKRASYLALHNGLTGIGIFCGALLGGSLAPALPGWLAQAGWHTHWTSNLYGVFVISAVARFTVATVFLPRMREVRPVRPMTVRRLIVRATRFNALAGMLYDIVGSRRRRTAADEPPRRS